MARAHLENLASIYWQQTNIVLGSPTPIYITTWQGPSPLYPSRWAIIRWLGHSGHHVAWPVPKLRYDKIFGNLFQNTGPGINLPHVSSLWTQYSLLGPTSPLNVSSASISQWPDTCMLFFMHGVLSLAEYNVVLCHWCVVNVGLFQWVYMQVHFRQSRGHLNIQSPSYQYRDSHYKDGKTSRWSYLYNGTIEAGTGKTLRPARCHSRANKVWR